jgi:hypothetical protein
VTYKLNRVLLLEAVDNGEKVTRELPLVFYMEPDNTQQMVRIGVNPTMPPMRSYMENLKSTLENLKKNFERTFQQEIDNRDTLEAALLNIPYLSTPTESDS